MIIFSYKITGMIRNSILWIIAFLPLVAVAAPVLPASNSATEIITITVKATGGVSINGVSCLPDHIHSALGKKLWNKYLATKKMQDRIKIKFVGEVLMGTRGATMDEVLQAQQETLKKLCLRKYGQEFDMLSATRQSFVRRNFPVLFQELNG